MKGVGYTLALMVELQGMERLDDVIVVLVETSHPGNIGASARAMKTMGLRRLRLVAPKRFPSAEATERAAGADDILYDAEVVGTLDEALAGTAWAVATSARERHLDWPMMEPHACAEALLARAGESAGPLALVFGRERSGLTNEELDRCQSLVCIPTAPNYRSLNLAAAVQLLSYELRKAVLDTAVVPPVTGRPLATPVELEGLYTHLEQALEAIGYFDPARPRLLMRRLRRLFARAALERSELNILRGILAAAEGRADHGDPIRADDPPSSG